MGSSEGHNLGMRDTRHSLYPVEACETVEEHYPDHCIGCGSVLQGNDPEPYRVQNVDIPPVTPVVREHRFHAITCDRCGTTTRAWDDEIINGSRYGERVVAHVGVLSGQYRQSHRMVQELLLELFGVELSVGSINQLHGRQGDEGTSSQLPWQESSTSVAAAVDEAHDYVQQQAQVNMDETSFALRQQRWQESQGQQRLVVGDGNAVGELFCCLSKSFRHDVSAVVGRSFCRHRGQ